MKPLAAKILDNLAIAYELREYEVTDEDFNALAVAEKIGLAPCQVFKTLVARSSHKVILIASVAADRELDLKALAKVSGEKKVELVPVKEIQKITGYVRGSVSPLGMKRSYPYYLDSSAFDHKVISISAGQKGLQLILSPADLQRITHAKLVEIST
ncbi:MAG: Cys-tRNA(Pro) deacylase [Acidobacteriota bacterium]|nr:Cys-tRNA(Pro) deacylase [Blastocatellia bacterium]MDW8412289.1 Cys-tRNA(Pro) deacylase [Acidobacteriota bacterium]